MGRLTDVGPAGLVPAAWLVTLGAHAGDISDRTLLIALLVMDVLLAAFFLASRDEMTGVLAVWERVIVVGLLVNIPGTVALAVAPDETLALAFTLYGWMILPGLAYVLTGRAHADSLPRRIYIGAGVLSLVGPVVYAVGHLGGVSPDLTIVGGLVLVGIGQTVGIVTAVLQNTGRVPMQ